MLTTVGLAAPGVSGWLLAPLLLVAIRPVLVFVTAARVLDRRARLFVGFYGARGVAALFYAAVVVDSGVLDAREQHVVVWTAIVCVVISVVAHGLGAAPLTRRWLGGT